MTGDDDVIDISVLLIDGDPIDVLLRGDVPGDMAGLAELVSLIRAVGEGPPPAASPELADLIARGARPASRTARHPAPTHRGALARVAGVGIAVKLSLGVTAAAAAGVAGAGAAGVLPGETGSAVRRAIEVVTPIEMPPPTGGPNGGSGGTGRATAGDGGDGAGHDGRWADGYSQGGRDGDHDGDRSGEDRSLGDRDGRDGRAGAWWADDDHDDDTAARGDDADDRGDRADDRPEEPDDPPVRPRRLR